MDQLELFRKEIDVIDGNIIKLLADRTYISEKIATYKKNHTISMMQPERISLVMSRSANTAKSYNISEKMVEEIFMTIINYSCELEDKIIKEL